MKDQTYITVRTASPWDAEQILAVYAPYVEHTAITFEYEVPDLEEFQKRIGTTLQRYPYLVSERGKEIVGFAYLSPFKVGLPMTGRRKYPSMMKELHAKMRNRETSL